MDYLSVLSNLVAVAALFFITCPNESKGFVSVDYNVVVDYNAEVAEQIPNNPLRVLPLRRMNEISKKTYELEPVSWSVLKGLETASRTEGTPVGDPRSVTGHNFQDDTTDSATEHNQKITEKHASDRRSNRALSPQPASLASVIADCKRYGRFRQLCIANAMEMDRELKEVNELQKTNNC